jgi:hypothetical protein
VKPIYLDYNATTPIDPEVAVAMRLYLEEHFGNPYTLIIGFSNIEANILLSEMEGGRLLRGPPVTRIRLTSLPLLPL